MNGSPRVFYHADRGARLTEGQTIDLHDGLSVFGHAYWHVMGTTNPESLSDAERREFELETIRVSVFKETRVSRMTALFAAHRIEDAVRFAEEISPRPPNDSPIFEVWATWFGFHDMNWLDYSAPPDLMRTYYEAYWDGETSNHQPATGPRRPPRREVLVLLPAVIRKRVAVVPGL